MKPVENMDGPPPFCPPGVRESSGTWLPSHTCTGGRAQRFAQRQGRTARDCQSCDPPTRQPIIVPSPFLICLLVSGDQPSLPASYWPCPPPQSSYPRPRTSQAPHRPPLVWRLSGPEGGLWGSRRGSVSQGSPMAFRTGKISCHFTKHLLSNLCFSWPN